MAKLLFWRAVQLVAVLFLILSLAFLAVRLIPGDPASVMLGAHGTPQQVADLRVALGLNRPIEQQYLEFMSGVIHGNLGESYFFQKPVAQLVLDRLPFTMQLSIVTMVWVLFVGIPLGIFAAIRADTLYDHLLQVFVSIGQATASFWLAIMLILIFGVQLRWLPTFGVGTWQHMVLPSLALGLTLLPRVMRFVRTGMVEVLHQDYILTARAKGLPHRLVIRRHAVRNMLIPLVTDSGLAFAWLLGGSVIIETVFALPGLGRLTVDAVQSRDYFLIQGAVLIFSFIFLLINAAIDLSYSYLDPRTRVAN